MGPSPKVIVKHVINTLFETELFAICSEYHIINIYIFAGILLILERITFRISEDVLAFEERYKACGCQVLRCYHKLFLVGTTTKILEICFRGPTTPR